MARPATGVDVGLRTAKFIAGTVKGNTFVVSNFHVSTYAANNLETAWAQAAPPFVPTTARVGLTGRDVNIRYTRVPRLPEWQLRKLMRFEVEEVGGQSGAEVASDFNLLAEMPEIEGEDVVLLAMARETFLEQHLAGLTAIGGKLDAFTPNALGLYNAWLHYGVVMDDTVLIANIGHEHLDVVLTRGVDLLFARNLSGGSKLFDDAIAARLGVSAAEAERSKRSHATLRTNAAYRDAAEERTSRACLGAAGQLLSLLQSTVLFCKSQVKLSGLKVDRVMICGGGAALTGLDQYLAAGMDLPVERFDPFRVVDTSRLDAAAAEDLDDHRLEAVVALGLATMASEPKSYSVEILPARLQKRREFWGGTAYMLAAAALALLFLGFSSLRRSGELEDVRNEVRTLTSQWNRARASDQSTRALLTENRSLAELAHELAAISGAGEQAARALAVVEAALPPDFWLTLYSESTGFDAELGLPRGEERPILHLEGRTREGTESVALLFQDFVERVRSQMPGVAMKESLSNTGQRFAVDLSLLAPADDDAAEAAEPAAGGGGES